MILGKVVGKAVATAKHASLHGARLIVVEPVRAASLDPVIALDELGAQAGDTVVLSSDGKFARQLVNDIHSPARWFVMGIVDEPSGLAAGTAEGKTA